MPQLSQTDISPQANVTDEPTLLCSGQRCELIDAVLETENGVGEYNVKELCGNMKGNRHLDLGVVGSNSKPHQTKRDGKFVQDVDMHIIGSL